jgi:hypothetical protein
VLLAVLAALALAGCTSGPAPEPKPAAPTHSADGPSPVPDPPLTRLTAPPAAPGELSRRVLSAKDGHPDNVTILRRSPRAGQEYWLHAACTSATPGKTLSAEVRSGEPGATDDAMTTIEIACDGTVAVNGLGTLPAESIVVYLQGDQSDVLSGYAVIAPAPSLPDGE